jgi:hypothetical protein
MSSSNTFLRKIAYAFGHLGLGFSLSLLMKIYKNTFFFPVSLLCAGTAIFGSAILITSIMKRMRKDSSNTWWSVFFYGISGYGALLGA